MYSANIKNNLTEAHNKDHKQRGMVINEGGVCISLTTANVIKINYLSYPESYHSGYDFKTPCKMYKNRKK